MDDPMILVKWLIYYCILYFTSEVQHLKQFFPEVLLTNYKPSQDDNLSRSLCSYGLAGVIDQHV